MVLFFKNTSRHGHTVAPCTESERKARTGVEGREEEREEVGREGTQTAEHTHAPLSNPAAGDGKGGSAERLQSADCSTWDAGLSIVEAVGTERGAIWNIYLQRNPFSRSIFFGLDSWPAKALCGSFAPLLSLPCRIPKHVIFCRRLVDRDRNRGRDVGK